METCLNPAERSVYLPHAASDNIPELARTREDGVLALWVDFAQDVRKARPCGCSRECRAIRVNFGQGPEVQPLADALHNAGGSLPLLGIPSGESLVEIARLAGWVSDVDEWIDRRLQSNMGWSLAGLWAATRNYDSRHKDCPACVNLPKWLTS